MGLIDFINKFKKIKQNFKYAKMLNGYTPIFSQFGQDIYASDVVQQAISCLVTELIKANPYQTPPPYEKLIGDLKGLYSRRINIQHRLIYAVNEDAKTIKILSLWSHYENIWSLKLVLFYIVKYFIGIETKRLVSH